MLGMMCLNMHVCWYFNTKRKVCVEDFCDVIEEHSTLKSAKPIPNRTFFGEEIVLKQLNNQSNMFTFLKTLSSEKLPNSFLFHCFLLK